MKSSILMNFLLLMTILFIVPKLFQKFRIPSATTEILLGISLGIIAQDFFYEMEFIDVLASLGIISFFIYSGIEIDMRFINRNRSMLLECLAIKLLVLLVTIYAIAHLTTYDFRVASLIALALITPSAGFIIQNVREFKINKILKQGINANVILAEVMFIFLFIFFINLTNITKAVQVVFLISVWIFFLPRIIEFLYVKVLYKVIDIEFPLLFFIGLISAFFTDYLGLHFIVGAFIAGVFIENFLNNLEEDRKIDSVQKISLIDTFKSISLIFLPFYFFSIGLSVNGYISLEILSIALLLFIVINGTRLVIHLIHRILRFQDTLKNSFLVSIMILPTVIFTIVVADILLREKIINPETFAILVLYGTFTTFLPILAKVLIKKFGNF